MSVGPTTSKRNLLQAEGCPTERRENPGRRKQAKGTAQTARAMTKAVRCRKEEKPTIQLRPSKSGGDRNRSRRSRSESAEASIVRSRSELGFGSDNPGPARSR